MDKQTDTGVSAIQKAEENLNRLRVINHTKTILIIEQLLGRKIIKQMIHEGKLNMYQNINMVEFMIHKHKLSVFTELWISNTFDDYYETHSTLLHGDEAI